MSTLDGLLPIYVAIGGRAMLVMTELSKTRASKVRVCDEQLNDTDVRLLVNPKAFLPMLVIEAGMIIDVRPVL